MKMIFLSCKLFLVEVLENKGFIEMYCVRVAHQPERLTELVTVWSSPALMLGDQRFYVGRFGC
jgi:predicted thioredoxin/glutaredoxin